LVISFEQLPPYPQLWGEENSALRNCPLFPILGEKKIQSLTEGAYKEDRKKFSPSILKPTSGFSSTGAGAAMSDGKKMRALTATRARENIRTASNGAI
jgi:hypothetical protein